MATAYGNVVQHWQCYMEAFVVSQTDTQATVRCNCYFHSIGWGYDTAATGTATVNGQSASNRKTASSGTGATVNQLFATKDVTVSRKGSGYNISCSAKMQLTGGYHNGTSTCSVSVLIPARAYNAHGTPTIKSSKSTANYSEAVTLSWSKSGTQGNASFNRFELWQGDVKLYSGSGISLNVVPSSVTGPRGGTATYTLKEVHEWYGSYPSTQTSVSISVRSGVVSVYDGEGNRHTGLVTAYDSEGNSHYVLISAYDADGSPHSVV